MAGVGMLDFLKENLVERASVKDFAENKMMRTLNRLLDWDTAEAEDNMMMQSFYPALLQFPIKKTLGVDLNNLEASSLFISNLEKALNEDLKTRVQRIESFTKRDPEKLANVLMWIIEEKKIFEILARDFDARAKMEEAEKAFYALNPKFKKLIGQQNLIELPIPETIEGYAFYLQAYKLFGSTFLVHFNEEDRPKYERFKREGNAEVTHLADYALRHLDLKKEADKQRKITFLITNEIERLAKTASEQRILDKIMQFAPGLLMLMGAMSLDAQLSLKCDNLTETPSDKRNTDLIFNLKNRLLSIYNQSEAPRKLFTKLFKRFSKNYLSYEKVNNLGTKYLLIELEVKSTPVVEPKPPKKKKKKKLEETVAAGAGAIVKEEVKETPVVSPGPGPGPVVTVPNWMKNQFPEQDYMKRVRRWFKAENFPPFREYSHMGASEWEKMRVFHGFSRLVDKLIFDEEFALCVDKPTRLRSGEIVTNRYYRMFSHISGYGYGRITYARATNGKFYHRFHTEISAEAMKRFGIFDSLDTFNIEADTGQEESLEGEALSLVRDDYRQNDLYGFVQIIDKIFNITITIFKLPKMRTL